MKKLSILSLIAFAFLSMFIVSCQKENFDKKDVNEETHDPTEKTLPNSLLTRSVNTSDGLELDCITIPYPFEMVDDENTLHTVSDLDDFLALYSDSTIFIIDFVYPLIIELEDGTTATVNNIDELADSFAGCLPNGWSPDLFPAYLIGEDNSCYELAYPVTVQDADGNQETAQDETAFVALIADEAYFFVFPLSLVETETNTTITVESIDDLLNTLLSCNSFVDPNDSLWNQGFNEIGCYGIVFPLGVTLEDGTTVTVNNHMEFCDLMLSGEVTGFAYPLTLIDEDGQEIVVNSEEELEAALTNCEYVEPADYDLVLILFGSLDTIGVNHCFDAVYPIQAEQFDEDQQSIGTVTFNSLQEILDVYGDPTVLPYYNIVYPIEITLTATGQTQTVSSTEELYQILEDCF